MKSTRLRLLLVGAMLTTGLANSARAAGDTVQGQATDDTTPVLPDVTVQSTVPVAASPATAPAADGSAAAGYRVKQADLGPLGNQNVQDTPYSLTIIPAALIENDQAKGISDIIKYDPSAQIEPRGDLDFGRPQTRGFENANTENTRIDGLNSYTIMAYPMEEYETVQILNGAAGALYGPSSPGGVFNFVPKRPTDTPMEKLTFGYDGLGMATEHLDVGGRAGPNDMFGYRVNLLNGEGTSYVDHSHLERDLASGNFDVRFTPDTRLELNLSHYNDDESGLPAAFVYGAPHYASQLPSAPNPAKVGYGVEGAGQTLNQNIVGLRLDSQINPDWKFTIGAQYLSSYRTENPTNGAPADPYLALLNNSGAYNVYVSDTGLRTKVWSDLAYLNGHVTTGSLTHDIFLGTNGFAQLQYTRFGADTPNPGSVIGTSSIADPTLFSWDNPKGGSFYKSGYNGQQSIIAGDTITFTPQWSALIATSASWLGALSYNTASKITSQYDKFGLSPTASLIFKPVSSVTAYFTYADALQQGDSLTTTTGNTLYAPMYRSTDFEIGGKWTIRDSLDLAAAVFDMKRPWSYLNANNAIQNSGRQNNTGFEISAKGKILDSLTVFGGLTYLDPVLTSTSSPATTDKLVVGVPRYQANLYLEYAPPDIHGLSVDLNAHYTGRRAANANNTTWAAGYATLDLGARYDMKFYKTMLTWRVGVDNVTNTHYWAAILAQNQGGSMPTSLSTSYAAFLGAPRVFHASLSISL